MKVNADLVIHGERVLLVPYRREHVETYHAWMKDPFLQEATASEPLTLEEEYDMQKSWSEDEDKCTFIVLDKETPEPGSQQGYAMVGDTNLFFNDPESRSSAEIEVMIAEGGRRRRGLGGEATRVMMAYAVSQLGVTRFVAKIGEANAASLTLFSRSLGFTEISRSTIFREVTLELLVDGAVREFFEEFAGRLEYGAYDGRANDSAQ